MRLVIAGPREGTTYADVEKAVELALTEWGLDTLEVSEVVSGGCRGTDLYGEEWAASRDIPIKRFDPDWGTHGKAAGPIRNKQMAEYGDRVVVCWDGASSGTRSMILETKRLTKPIYIHKYKEFRH